MRVALYAIVPVILVGYGICSALSEMGLFARILTLMAEFGFTSLVAVLFGAGSASLAYRIAPSAALRAKKRKTTA